MGSYALLKITIALVYFAQTLTSGQGEYTYNYIGCFKDNPTNRALTGPSSSPEYNTVDICVEICANGNYRYAGLQSIYLCNCGNLGYNKYGEDSSGCEKSCPGNNSQKCGGISSTSVYEIVDPTTTTTTTTPSTTTSTSPDIDIKTHGSNDSSHLDDTQSSDKPMPNKGRKMTAPDVYVGAIVGAVVVCAVIVLVIVLVVRKRRVSKEANGLPTASHIPSNCRGTPNSTSTSANVCQGGHPQNTSAADDKREDDMYMNAAFGTSAAEHVNADLIIEENPLYGT